MNTQTINGQQYRLPNALNSFQLDLYIHLIDWKWQHITKQPGKARGHEYDAILPDSYAGKMPMLYPPIVPALNSHIQKFPFRIHKYFNHMASSQAANINLFLPFLLHSRVNDILKLLKPDFDRLATEQLDKGYRIEFWDEPYGNLFDKTEVSGTDSDIAIAYYNKNGQLCLWLIEHKLTEKEFTECGGFKSKGRKEQHDCSRTFTQILKDKDCCYYHDVRRFNYWNITESNQSFFSNHAAHEQCPFQGGMNQLWRNQLLGLSIEHDDRQPFKQVYFSVVRHPRNTALDESIRQYKELTADNPKFSVFTSQDVVDAAKMVDDTELNKWIEWYRRLYKV
jgi:hypothetical protein